MGSCGMARRRQRTCERVRMSGINKNLGEICDDIPFLLGLDSGSDLRGGTSWAPSVLVHFTFLAVCSCRAFRFCCLFQCAEQSLVCGRLLYEQLSLAVDCQHLGAVTLLESLQMRFSISAKIRERHKGRVGSRLVFDDLVPHELGDRGLVIWMLRCQVRCSSRPQGCIAPWPRLDPSSSRLNPFDRRYRPCQR